MRAVELDCDGSKPISQIFRTLDHELLRLLLVFMASSIVLIAGDGRREVRAEPQAARIVALGASTCRQFNEDIRLNPSVQRDYLAWGQGYMSGILVGRPPGVDQGLDLNPPTFDMINQLHFLRDYCAENTSANFADAVEALYKRLRREGKTRPKQSTTGNKACTGGVEPARSLPLSPPSSLSGHGFTGL